MVLLALAVAASALLVLGYPEADGEGEVGWFPYLVLAVNPFMLAVGAIIMRTMKNLHEAVVSTYLNLALLLTSAILISATLKSSMAQEKYRGFSFFVDFDWISWFLVFLNGVNTVLV